MYTVTALVETSRGKTTEKRIGLTAEQIEQAKRHIKSGVPIGSSITFKVIKTM